METATFAGGCFWCVEAVFKRLKGVETVVSGYAGEGKAPTYEQVGSGNSDFTEAIQCTFDPEVISFKTLLEVFWAVHDPTTLNRQGADVGTQYRSAIFYHNEAQRTEAQESMKIENASGNHTSPIVTSIEPLVSFYPAEAYHQDYYDQNRQNGYCRFVIDPKVQKLYKKFEPELKAEYQGKE